MAEEKNTHVSPLAYGITGAIVGAMGAVAVIMLSDKDNRKKVEKKLLDMKDWGDKKMQEIKVKTDTSKDEINDQLDKLEDEAIEALDKSKKADVENRESSQVTK